MLRDQEAHLPGSAAGSGVRVRRRSAGVLLGLALLVCALVPGSAVGAELHASPGNLSSVFAGARGGDTILLGAGSYGQFNGGSKPALVTLRPEPGAAVSMSVFFSSAVRFVRIEGVTLTGAELNGARDVALVGSRFTGQATIRTPANVSNANILFDGDTFDGIDACSSCDEGRLTVAGANNTAPVGVAVTNSHFGNGGCSDGVQIVGGANGVQIGPGNEFTGILQNCTRHVDSIQLYGSRYTRIVGNYFHDNDVIIMAPDYGNRETITDNLMIGGDYKPAVQLGSHDGTTFSHNTLKDVDVYMDKKSESPTPSSNGIVQDNIFMNGAPHVSSPTCTNCTVDHNMFTVSAWKVGTNTLVGTPIFTGGTAPTTYTGHQLAANSPGKNNASDGTDHGARIVPGAPSPGSRPNGGAGTSPPGNSCSKPRTRTTIASIAVGIWRARGGRLVLKGKVPAKMISNGRVRLWIQGRRKGRWATVVKRSVSVRKGRTFRLTTRLPKGGVRVRAVRRTAVCATR